VRSLLLLHLCLFYTSVPCDRFCKSSVRHCRRPRQTTWRRAVDRHKCRQYSLPGEVTPSVANSHLRCPRKRHRSIANSGCRTDPSSDPSSEAECVSSLAQLRAANFDDGVLFPTERGMKPSNYDLCRLHLRLATGSLKSMAYSMSLGNNVPL